jgi:diaminopimelate epimerase
VHGNGVRARIFERGVGETLSSGTGASGAAVSAFLRGAPSPITVGLDGGELTVEVTDELEVRLTGSAERVFAGKLSREFVRVLEDA